MQFDFIAFLVVKAVSFGAAFIMIVFMMTVVERWERVQKIVAPLSDGVRRMEGRADKGSEGANIGIGVAHGLKWAGALIAAAMLAGVAH